MTIQEIKKKALKEIGDSQNLKQLNGIFQKYLGKTGEINSILKSFKEQSLAQRKIVGQEINLCKNFLKKKIAQQEEELKEEMLARQLKDQSLDVAHLGVKIKKGHLHPLTKVLNEIEEVFKGMGFSIIEGPEIETEHYNFDALNIPLDHPARDVWDTFWLSNKKLLRTHTSPAQVHYMEKHNPPFRIIVPGRCFRHEATDSSHDIQFHQLEGLMVGEKVSISNFKAVIEELFSTLLGEKVKTRIRPSYFPFTEPSFEIDIKRNHSSEWLEIMGAGMVHQNVFKEVGYLPQKWQGFAFGIGIDRLAMIKYNIEDVRLFYNGDLRFIHQF